MSVWVLSGGGVLCLGMDFFRGGVRVLAGGIGPGVPFVMALAAPEADTLDSGDAGVLRGFVDRGVAVSRVDERRSSFLSFPRWRNCSKGLPFFGCSCP